MRFVDRIQARDTKAVCQVLRLRARQDFRCARRPTIPAWLRDELRPGRTVRVIDTMVGKYPRAIGIGLCVPIGGGQDRNVRVDVDQTGHILSVGGYGYI
jgi:hypothetical protein